MEREEDESSNTDRSDTSAAENQSKLLNPKVLEDDFSDSDDEITELYTAYGNYTGEKNSHGKPHGKGILAEKGQKIYEGNFQDGKFSGFGIFYFKDGNIRYQGNWVSGKNSGKGINYFHNGSKEYEGDWLANQSHGFGKQYYKNGEPKYVGNWFHNNYQGIGQEFRKDGTLIYEGFYKTNEWDGEGTEYRKDGQKKIHEGRWKDR
jgi:antitoxin component YwqK of YwqJK toxin-antitoxin module